MVQTLVGSLTFALLALVASSGCSKSKCEACAQDSDCGSGLACHPEAKVCRPPGDAPVCPEECLKSKHCSEQGLCSLKGTRCVVGSDDCTRSAQCIDQGKCTRQDLGEVGTCVTVSPEDCKKSNFCRTKGHCSVDRAARECRALSDADCAAAEACTSNKKCKANEGKCVETVP